MPKPLLLAPPALTPLIGSKLPLAVIVSPEAVIDDPAPQTKRPSAPLPLEVTVVPVMVRAPPFDAVTLTAKLPDVVTEPPVKLIAAPESAPIPFEL
jgi:hypothetical protein